MQHSRLGCALREACTSRANTPPAQAQAKGFPEDLRSAGPGVAV